MADTSTTLQLARICQYLAANDSQRQSLFLNNSIVKTLSRLIYIVRTAIQAQYDKNLITTQAISPIVISGTGSVGDEIDVYFPDPELGEILLGTYTLVSGDTTNTIIATHVAAAIIDYGYSATSLSTSVYVKARVGLGATANGLSPTITYTPSFLLINSTDIMMINSTDKFII